DHQPEAALAGDPRTLPAGPLGVEAAHPRGASLLPLDGRRDVLRNDRHPHAPCLCRRRRRGLVRTRLQVGEHAHLLRIGRRHRLWVIVAVVAAVFNPLFNAMAMPVTERLFNNAAIGASVSTVLTEVVLMGGALILRPAGVFNRSTVGLLGRIVAASCCMLPT